MEKNTDYVRLVKQAQLGDRECLDRLTELADDRLRVDIYRLTLQRELTQEIIQETLFEMFKVLKDLEDAHRFWPWLYRIALNKIHLHHRKKQRRKTVPLSAVAGAGSQKDSQEVMANVISHELKEIVFTAMRALKPRQRAVLTMRCYREMEYSDIAESMGCSEFAAKMLFYRAKKTLRKQLSRNGLSRGSLLVALVLFGKMTAPSEAAAQVSVMATATKVGLLTGFVGLVTSKTAIISLTTAGVLAVGTIMTTSAPPLQQGREAESLPIFSPLGQSANGSEEYWYYFPEGVKKPMMMRARAGAGPKSASGGYCQVLQDDQANYYYYDNAIHINNHRMYAGNLDVFRLPTDSPELTAFLSQVEGDRAKIQYVPTSQKGLLVVATRREDEGSNYAWVTRHYNVLDEDYFQCDWPAGMKIIDNRDTMHKRGWTYFRITGQVNGEKVSGLGRIPFVYAASKQFSPWLKLQAGDKLSIVDNGAEARVYGQAGAPVARYKGGSFFKGLARPWMGLHTIDTVRRDAVEKHIWFETKLTPDGNKAKVKLTFEKVNLVYTIDLETDVIDEIAFSTTDASTGQLRFSYLQNIDGVDGEFATPRSQGHLRSQQKGNGILWLAQLAEGSLVK